jgi:hypothetical protein
MDQDMDMTNITPVNEEKKEEKKAEEIVTNSKK